MLNRSSWFCIARLPLLPGLAGALILSRVVSHESGSDSLTEVFRFRFIIKLSISSFDILGFLGISTI